MPLFMCIFWGTIYVKKCIFGCAEIYNLFVQKYTQLAQCYIPYIPAQKCMTQGKIDVRIQSEKAPNIK